MYIHMYTYVYVCYVAPRPRRGAARRSVSGPSRPCPAAYIINSIIQYYTIYNTVSYDTIQYNTI